jgi:hypothetical protein
MFVHGPDFLSINPFELQLKINSKSIIPSDFYYVKSYIGFPFDDLHHEIIMKQKENILHVSTTGKALKTAKQKYT